MVNTCKFIQGDRVQLWPMRIQGRVAGASLFIQKFHQQYMRCIVKNRDKLLIGIGRTSAYVGPIAEQKCVYI